MFAWGTSILIEPRSSLKAKLLKNYFRLLVGAIVGAEIIRKSGLHLSKHKKKITVLQRVSSVLVIRIAVIEG